MVFHSNILHCTVFTFERKMMKIRALVIIIIIVSVIFQLLRHSQTFLLPTKASILILTETKRKMGAELRKLT